jgi:FixJ family two-component response regulator
VVDINLPDSDGIELASSLAARRIILSAVFFSAIVDADTEMRARRHGAFVHKTDGMPRLIAAVEAAVSRARPG